MKSEWGHKRSGRPLSKLQHEALCPGESHAGEDAVDAGSAQVEVVSARAVADDEAVRRPRLQPSADVDGDDRAAGGVERSSGRGARAEPDPLLDVAPRGCDEGATPGHLREHPRAVDPPG